jgi:hypothetical protein
LGTGGSVTPTGWDAIVGDLADDDAQTLRAAAGIVRGLGPEWLPGLLLHLAEAIEQQAGAAPATPNTVTGLTDGLPIDAPGRAPRRPPPR